MVANFQHCGNMHHGGEGVVQQLRHVHVIVGVYVFLLPIRPPNNSMARFKITSLSYKLD